MSVPLILNNCLKSVPNFIFMLKSIYFYNRRSLMGMKKYGQLAATKFIITFMVICGVVVLIFSNGLAQNLMGWINGPTEGVITGIVTDADTNEPIPDALMTLKYHDIVRTKLTDSMGRYTFTDVPICFCLKNISASKEGYESQYKMVAVHKITHVDFSLKPIEDGSNSMYGIITGIVTDAETNDPIPHALMVLKYHDIIRTEVTDSKGQYTFTKVPLCFCLKNISASKNGYESQFKMVAVHKITYVNFSLEPIEDGGNSMYGIITGVVIDAETNDPIPDALMTLKYHGLIRTEHTDSDGWYTFTEVPICFCLKNISASKEGYESQYKLVAVYEITYANFSLNLKTEGASDADSNFISGRSEGEETFIESKSYLLVLTGLLAILSVLLIGINIGKIKKISHDRKR
jgi:hypothetical protein